MYDAAIVEAIKNAGTPLRHRDLVALLAPDDKGHRAFGAIGMALTKLHRAGTLARRKTDHGVFCYWIKREGDAMTNDELRELNERYRADQLAAHKILDTYGVGDAGAKLEIRIARALAEAERRGAEQQKTLTCILHTALKAIDHHIVGAYEVAHSDQPEPCEECIEMREIAEQALEQYRAAQGKR